MSPGVHIAECHSLIHGQGKREAGSGTLAHTAWIHQESDYVWGQIMLQDNHPENLKYDPV